MSLKLIKNKIRSVDKTHQVTKAMGAVSAVKMRKSQERALVARPYARGALAILQRVAGSIDAVNHPLTAERDVKKTCFLVVTSDKGLAGSLNTAVLKATVRTLEEKNISKEDAIFICIGNKGYEFFTKRGFTVHKYYDNLGDDVSIDEMKDVTGELVELFVREEIDRCDVVYTNFISTFEQEAVIRQLLPLSFDEIENVIKGIIPEKGKFAEKVEEKTSTSSVYTIEPNPEEVFTELLPYLLNIEIYHSLIEAKASEHSARMVAMKNASDKAEEMSEELTLKYNKARQSLITREVSEIIGGMEVMK